MYLKSLEMQGFKSFPDKTVLDFGKGITSVVGPNGSGKSNISDAVRWVLGEQSTKSLRGSKMEDVIFSGTNVRKAQGFAEVTLRLDNSDRTMPGCDRDEVAVTRRYYRSGESEYILNGETVRLKDVHSMFMDTGLGRDGYSIVSQGKVADMVSSKSNQRREMLEEASGISHYRYRRTDAGRKLEQAEENLIRLRDILAELEGRVGPLKIQSEKAKKFLVLADERKKLEIGLWLHTTGKLKASLAEQEDKMSVASAQYAQVEAELAELEENEEKASQKSRDITAKIEQLRTDSANVEERAAHIDAQVAVELNSITHNNETIDRITRDMEAAVASRRDLDDSITDEMATVAMLKNAEAQKRAQLADAVSELEGMDSRSGEFAEKIAVLSEKISLLAVQIGDSRVRLSAAVSSIEETGSRIGTIDGAVAVREEACAKLEENAAAARRLLAEGRELAASLENTVAGYQMRVINREDKCSEAQKEIDTLGIEIDKVVSRSKMLDGMEKNMEGYSGSVKAVVRESGRGRLRGIHGALSRLISVDEKYAAAIETALGAAIQNIVTDNENDAKRAISYLKESKEGRATFLPISSISGRTLDEKGLDDAYGFIAMAHTLVKCDKKYDGIVTSLLGKTAVVEDMDAAVAIAKKYSYRFKLVTLDGQVVNPGGSMTGGSRVQNAGILSRANEIEKLNKKAKELEQELIQKREVHKTLLEGLSAAKAELDGAEADLTRAQEDVIRREGEVTLAENTLTAAREAIEELKTEKSTAEERLAALEKQRDSAKEQAQELEKQSAGLQEEIRSADMGRRELDENRTQLKTSEGKLKLELLAVQKDIQAKLEIVASLRHRISDHGDRVEDLNAEITKIALSSIEIKKNVLALEAEAQELREHNKNFGTDVEKLASEREETDASVTSLRALEREKSADRERLSGELARLEERRAVMEQELEETVNKLYDEYQLTRREAQEQGYGVDEPAKAQRELQEIRGKIRALGSVNVDAIDEYREVSERYEFMSGQIDDIEKSREELLKLIGELTAKMSEQFRTQFVKINAFFGETFSELFDGGKAELILENPLDVLECPIEIKVQPPGKNVQNIDLLSGGEKGLSAIALLFAILKVSPAPFCFFDEVEAALDEVNVTRYAQYARRMTKNTQFILITHRRGTMEEADVLYGVTMQEKGVSKLLELKTAEMAKRMGLA